MQKPHRTSANSAAPLRVVVFGGGLSCWLAASYLKSELPDLAVSVLEHDERDAALDAFQTVHRRFETWLERCGWSEDDWMRSCGATFKVAEKMLNWRVARAETPDDHYYRLASAMPVCNGAPLADYWFADSVAGARDTSTYACYSEPKLLDARLGPRHHDGSAAVPYGWHCDGRRLTELLRRCATAHGVTRTIATRTRPQLAQDGSLAALLDQDGRRFEAELFIDCSGFAARLVQGALGEPFIAASHGAVCDSAVTLVVPQDDAWEGIDPYGSAIGMQAGWASKTPLLGRFGSHYFYSRRHASDLTAARELCDLWQVPFEHARPTITRLRPGRSRRGWVQNCVALGRAAGFVDPLATSELRLTCDALEALTAALRKRGEDPAGRFNARTAELFDDAQASLQLCYAASPRRDTPFWLACKDDPGLNRILRAQVERAQRWADHDRNFVLGAMGLAPARPARRAGTASTQLAETMFEAIRQRSEQLYAQLPTHFELLSRLHAPGQHGAL